MNKLLLLVFLPLFARADIEYASIINEIGIASHSVEGLGMVTVDADVVSFNISPGSFHAHNKSLNIKNMVVQSKKLADGSWILYKPSDKSGCYGSIQIGEQIRIKGKIGKKIHIYCERTKVKN